MIKLNLGCNSRILPGYVNIDFTKYPGVDVVSDVSKLPMYTDGSVDVIRASHILEHFRYNDTKRTLDEWFRVLKKDGLIYISVPSWERAVEIYHQAGLAEWLIYFIYGDQNAEGNYHYTAFDFERLKKYLEASGFSEVCPIDKMPDYLKDEANDLISTVDLKSISLSVMAMK